MLLEAAFDLLGTAGWAGTTVRAVCKGARLNPRYFYESFDDLDELLVAVYDGLVEELGAEVMVALEAAPRDRSAQTRATLERIVRFVDEDRRRGRVLYVEALSNEVLNRRRIETGHGLIEDIARAPTVRGGASSDREQVGRVTAAILVGGFSELLAGWLGGRIEVDREQLVDVATQLFLAIGAAANEIATVQSGRPRARRPRRA